MNRTIHAKQHAYRRRLLIISPVSALLVAILFFTSDVVPYDEIQKSLGWEGALEVLPEITIIPDRDPFEDFRESSRQKTMASMDVSVVNETADAEGGAIESPETKPDDIVLPEIDEPEFLHVPSHTDVPYTNEYIILHMIQPEYPPLELSNGVEGDVTVEILIDEEGNVENAWVLAVLGPRSFEVASLAAVKQFRFRPPVEDGKPIPMWVRFEIRFRITDAP